MPGKAARAIGPVLGAMLLIASFMSARFVTSSVRSAKRGPVANDVAVESRVELAMVYIGNSRCGWCNDTSLTRTFPVIRSAIEREAIRRNQTFVVIGIAVDPIAAEGVGHLSKFGSFDQLSAGGGWSNEAALKYFSGKLSGSPSTPTIIVVERDLVIPDSTHLETETSYRNERQLVRKSGVFEIKRWVSDGVPIPRVLRVTEHLQQSTARR